MARRTVQPVEGTKRAGWVSQPLPLDTSIGCASHGVCQHPTRARHLWPNSRRFSFQHEEVQDASRTSPYRHPHRLRRLVLGRNYRRLRGDAARSGPTGSGPRGLSRRSIQRHRRNTVLGDCSHGGPRVSPGTCHNGPSLRAQALTEVAASSAGLTYAGVDSTAEAAHQAFGSLCVSSWTLTDPGLRVPAGQGHCRRPVMR